MAYSPGLAEVVPLFLKSNSFFIRWYSISDSYPGVFLQNFIFIVNFDETRIDASVVPLALQLLIENAIKHNTFSKKSPLKIELFVDNQGYLNIINNLQNRKTLTGSTGIGLVNISKRYSLLSDVQPVFEMTENQFIARIPLIFNGNRATTETA